MFKKILCPLDGSDHSRKALALAIDLARSNKAGLVLLHGLLYNAGSSELQHFAEVEHLVAHVEPEVKRLMAFEGRGEYGYMEPPTSARVLTEVGQHILDEARRDAEESGIAEVKTHLVGGDVAAHILKCIDDEKVDCVVMGARGLSDAQALFLGSISHKVANQAPCTCITVK